MVCIFYNHAYDGPTESYAITAGYLYGFTYMVCFLIIVPFRWPGELSQFSAVYIVVLISRIDEAVIDLYLCPGWVVGHAIGE